LLPGLRAAYLLAAVLMLTILPVSESSVLLALFVAVDLAAAALFLDELPARPRTVALFLDELSARPRTVVAIGNEANLPLMRRTVPQLRSRRPAAIIEAQVSWRQAAEFRRRRRELTQRISS
jgi:hypothetical protein